MSSTPVPNDPAFPPALLAPVPRPVRRRPGSLRAPLVYAALFFVAVVVALISWSYLGARLLLVMAGQQVVGTVVEKTSADVYRNSFVTAHYITYAYLASGIRHTDKQEVTSAGAAGLRAGGAIIVTRIDLLGIEMSTIPNGRWDDLLGTWIAAVISSLLAAAFIFDRFILPARRRRLVRDGVAVIGQFIEKGGPSDKKGTSRPVKYRYPVADGQSCEKRIEVRRAFFDLIVVGQSVVVLYDPRNVKTAVLYIQCEFEASPIPQR